ncbi:11475_t:CDS:10 [Ambispora leptoticha]|uniref:11475_t:CDS:1 n=1 Tax=Ambispora leptoticha TaxID=144679 RepID=A0A9N8YY70_9GLOM|nr:11475_t:CDS:10 [Ambispora leptoticha]
MEEIIDALRKSVGIIIEWQFTLDSLAIAASGYQRDLRQIANMLKAIAFILIVIILPIVLLRFLRADLQQTMINAKNQQSKGSETENAGVGGKAAEVDIGSSSGDNIERKQKKDTGSDTNNVKSDYSEGSEKSYVHTREDETEEEVLENELEDDSEFMEVYIHRRKGSSKAKARTFNPVSSAAASNRSSPKSADEPLTRTQKKNIAKAAKLKEEAKIRAETQEARLLQHKKELERERIKEFVKQNPPNKQTNNKKTGPTASLDEGGHLRRDKDDVEMPDADFGDEEQEREVLNFGNTIMVTPGQLITSDPQYMKGHGTYPLPQDLMLSSVAGIIERVNKLVSVRPLHTRYTGDIGDLVIGRITEVTQKRWKVDINSRQDGVLQLSSINLPGGVQRRKTEEDELQMRKFFIEGDLLVAEIHAFFQDGAANLHTRSSKYGKLRNGSFINVPPSLVQRCKTHFHTLPCGIDVILGLNGYIWVCKHSAHNPNDSGGSRINTHSSMIINNISNNVDVDAIYSSQNEPIDDSTREKIARVCNCINVLSQKFIYINDTAIADAYDASLKFHVRELRHLNVIDEIASIVVAKVTSLKTGLFQ